MKHFALHGLLPFAGHPPPFITRTNEPTDDGCSRTCVNAAFIKIGAQHGRCPVQTPTREKGVHHLAKQGGGAHGPREKKFYRTPLTASYNLAVRDRFFSSNLAEDR